MTVIDDYQRQGIGAALLAGLSTYAALSKIKTFTMYIHTEQRGLVRALLSIGAVVENHESGVIEMHLPVPSKMQGITGPPDGHYYKTFLAAFGGNRA